MMKLFLFFLISTIVIFKVYSQKNKKHNTGLFLGLIYGQAAQDKFPFNNSNYLYSNKYFKFQINYLLSEKKKVIYELNIEPSIYFSEHQLLNKYFIQPNRGDDYLEQREKFTEKRSFGEYAINFGIILRCKIINSFSTYILGSIGPMISFKGTERLKKGFAFSDICGCGFSYQQKKLRFDLRLTVRHNSNFELFYPNNGHNSTGIEGGVSVQLR